MITNLDFIGEVPGVVAVDEMDRIFDHVVTGRKVGLDRGVVYGNGYRYFYRRIEDRIDLVTGDTFGHYTAAFYLERSKEIFPSRINVKFNVGFELN